jgi:hypothetical protein
MQDHACTCQPSMLFYSFHIVIHPIMIHTRKNESRKMSPRTNMSQRRTKDQAQSQKYKPTMTKKKEEGAQCQRRA